MFTLEVDLTTLMEFDRHGEQRHSIHLHQLLRNPRNQQQQQQQPYGLRKSQQAKRGKEDRKVQQWIRTKKVENVALDSHPEKTQCSTVCMWKIN